MMRISVTGGQPLRGEYRPGGNSNATMALIAASMLTDKPVHLQQVPVTASVRVMLDVAAMLGTQVNWQEDAGMLDLITPQITTRNLSPEMTAAKVGVIMFLPALLVRREVVRLDIGYPVSRLHTHLTALRDLGCPVTVNGQHIEIRMKPWQHREIILTQTSVTATAMVTMLAAAQPGKTTIHNAASEPHVRDLLVMLQAMGASIEGIGSNLLTICGSKSLKGIKQTIAPDHIEIASVAAIAAITGGRIDMPEIRSEDLRMIAKVYERLGLRLDLDDGHMHVARHDGFMVSTRDEDVDVSVETAPWPGFPSDLIAIVTLLATQAQGTILIHEKLFKDRLLFVDKLKGFGAQAVFCDPHRVVVVGPTPLFADYLDTPDTRTGLGLLGAALCAQGETVIDGADMFEWNFGDVLSRLQSIGAQIRVLSR